MHELLIVDTETGGLDPLKHSLLSVGAVVWRDGEIRDTFDVFVAEPQTVFENDALQINQIDLQWLSENGLSPSVAIQRFHEFLAKYFDLSERGARISLAGHNVAFDVGFLKRLYRLSNMNFDRIFSHRFVDTAGIVQFLILAGKLNLAGASSSEVFNYFDIYVEPGKCHTALGDALATAVLLNKLIQHVK